MMKGFLLKGMFFDTLPLGRKLRCLLGLHEWKRIEPGFAEPFERCVHCWLEWDVFGDCAVRIR